MTKYDIEILVKNKSIQKYTHESNTYVEGREGSNFELKLMNNTNKACLFIPSIDGLSIIDGKEASDSSGGYIVYAHSNIVIPGWTLDNKSVAKFTFSSKDRSYAANNPTNPSKANVGVIGCLVYSRKVKENDNFEDNLLDRIRKLEREKPYRPYEPYYPPIQPYWSWNGHNYYQLGQLSSNTSSHVDVNSNNFTSNCANVNGFQADSTIRSKSVDSTVLNTTHNGINESFSLGTEFGKQTDFSTTNETFERNKLENTLVIFYDTKKNLEKRGIITKKVENRVPNPFPSMGCKPPSNWR